MYVIAPHNNSTTGPVKLGISVDPERRLTQLQTGHHERLRLFHTEPVPSDRARLYERLLHRDVGHKRSHGEWFHLNVEDAIAQITFTLIQYDLVDNLSEKVRQHRI
jgi:hypothetical protein